MMTLVRVCSTTDVPAGEARRFPVDGRLVAVVNLGEEGFRAIDAICSHEKYYLDEGDVDTDFETIECPKHGSMFDLNTGAPRALPAIRPVPVYALTIDGDDLLIEV
jgi:3-phenylpropionate/trans-cinnamate dioxygenase ferredoxin component